MKKIAGNILWILACLTNSVLFYINFTAIGVPLDSRLTALLMAILFTSVTAYRFVRSKTTFRGAVLLVFLIITMLSVYELHFRYNEEQITFSNDGFKFYGTLYTPKSKPTDCLVIVIPGAGVEPRDEYGFYARNLARNGVSAFVYDKRGSGKSEGEVYAADYFAYAQDALSAIKELQKIHQFRKIGIYAVSEGEWVSLIVDSLIKIDFIVIISGSADTPLKQTHREVTSRLEKKGFDAISVKTAGDLYWRYLNYAGDSTEKKALKEELKANRDKPWFAAAEDIPDELYYSKWWLTVKDFDPVTYLQQSTTPILVAVGSENESYPAEESKRNYEAVSQNVEFVIYPGATHGMVVWPFGYKVPPPSFPRGFVEKYTTWILEHSR